MHSTTSSSGILVFVSLISAFLAVLKLVGLESLPWLWVLSPLWITALSLPVLLVIIGLRSAYLAWRAMKSPGGSSLRRWKQWYDSFGNRPFVP
jgi:hypothetical protein